jgi:hypothetical protein
MLDSGKKIRALRDKKNKYSISRVVGKQFLNETKNHNPPPPLKLKGGSLIRVFEKYLIRTRRDRRYQRGIQNPLIEEG